MILGRDPDTAPLPQPLAPRYCPRMDNAAAQRKWVAKGIRTPAGEQTRFCPKRARVSRNESYLERGFWIGLVSQTSESD